MATPSLAWARSHYGAQQKIALAAVAAVRRLFKQNAPLLSVGRTVASYQMASAQVASQAVAAQATVDPNALTNASAFAGVSSRGFSILEPIIATIDRFEPAPVEELPANWWRDAEAFMSAVEQLVESEVQDAGRSASQVEFVTRPDWQNYVRMLTPPSCDRCAILAGRIYRDLEAFQRHPNCDCVMVPVQDWQDAHDKGLVSSPREAFDKGFIRGLSEADTQAIRDGADIVKVVNAKSGITKVDGVKATTVGTTRRSAWRKANPSRLIRLRPEAIYEFAKDREDALRLLRLYGYLSS